MDRNLNPQAGVKEKIIEFGITYVAGKALDATVEAVKSVDWKEHSKKIDENVEKNIRDFCNDTKLPPGPW